MSSKSKLAKMAARESRGARAAFMRMRKKKPTPIVERINAAVENAGGKITFADLARVVFPDDQYPRAWRHAVGGGPPGCYMALSAALKRIPTLSDHSMGPGPGHRLITWRNRPWVV